jgi:hypothetical protein
VIWEVAIRERWVAEYINEEISLDELVEYLYRSSDFAESMKQVKKERSNADSKEEPENFRRLAINQIFAIEAAEIDVVDWFRSDWLPNRLLEMEAVEGWVAERKSIEGPSSTWITTLADDDGNPIAGDRDHVGYAESSRRLKFVVPDRRRIRSESVNAVGALIELASVAEILHRLYDWSEAWAATFVLTGTVPPAVMANWTSSEPWPWPKARRRMTITVRLDVQPTQLVKIYRERRNQMLRGEPMPRAIGEHKARLAIFAARHCAGYTWGETMDRWNRENPDNQFTSEPQFTRDSRDAFNRIMGEPLNWRGKLDAGEDRNGTR